MPSEHLPRQQHRKTAKIFFAPLRGAPNHPRTHLTTPGPLRTLEYIYSIRWTAMRMRHGVVSWYGRRYAVESSRMRMTMAILMAKYGEISSCNYMYGSLPTLSLRPASP